jgi:hypothetical protein
LKKTILPAVPGMFMIFLLVSCDILRNSPFEVSAWSPGGGFHDPGGVSLFLEFSHCPARTSVERHFSVTGDGSRLTGSFFWEGDRMIFLPHAPLEKNKDYEISLSADAMDDQGLSMDQNFTATFTTRPGSSRPRLLSVFPEDQSVLADERGELVFVFSQPFSPRALQEHISLSPGMDGFWSPGSEPGIFHFSPAEPWRPGQRYEIRVSGSLNGETGLTLGYDVVSVFTVGTDKTKPCLLGAWRLEKDGTLEELLTDPPAGGAFPDTVVENTGWEKDSRIRLVFSEPVDSASLKSCFSAEPAPALVQEIPAGFETAAGFHEEFIFRFAERPSWGSRFSFQLGAGIRDRAENESEESWRFRVFSDGAGSRPPALAGIRLPMAPGNAGAGDPEMRAFSPADLFPDLPIAGENNSHPDEPERYPYGEPRFTWIELYFDTAPGASIDRFPVMELFRIETSNNVLSFSARSIQDTDFYVADPHPGWESYQRLEVRGYLTNTINGGVVSFRINPGLADSLGNRSEETFRVSALK